MWLKVGELAKRSGLTVRALHHYDRIGLLSPSARSEGGYRLYTREDVARLHRIQSLKQFGCSLTDIKEYLSEQGTSILDLIDKQRQVLEARALRAQALSHHLLLLRNQLSGGKEAGLADWLTILEMMTLYEKHLSRDEIETLFARKAAGHLEEEWNRLATQVRGCMERGLPAESREARDLSWRWVRWLKEATGNDAGLAMKLRRIHQEGPKDLLYPGITSEMITYLSQAFAGARAALLAPYLSPEELAEVRQRQADHLLEWPALIAEVRQQMGREAAPDDPAVAELVRRWDRLFHDSFAGGDRALEEKIRSAFQKEPDLRVGIGVDESLLAFVEQARAHLTVEPRREEPLPLAAPKPTALRVAILRAVHQLVDRPPIFEDPLALKILGEAEEESLRRDLERYDTPLLRGLRASVAVRSRLAEEEWARAKGRGVGQYVILGAGLDTFAYRDRNGGRTFEVDLPATQRWKRERLRAAGIAEPASVSYVPADFERSTLGEALDGAGFSRDRAAFFSWLGVTMYLEEEAVADTLRFIASLPPASGIVFDYAVLPALLSPRELRGFEALSARAAGHGEPWKTAFDPEGLTARLRSLGFSEVENFTAAQITARYLSGRADGLRKSGVSRLVCARV